MSLLQKKMMNYRKWEHVSEAFLKQFSRGKNTFKTHTSSLYLLTHLNMVAGAVINHTRVVVWCNEKAWLLCVWQVYWIQVCIHAYGSSVFCIDTKYLCITLLLVTTWDRTIVLILLNRWKNVFWSGLAFRTYIGRSIWNCQFFQGLILSY